MKVACLSNQSSFLSPEQRGRLGEVVETYPLTVGTEYLVLGMGLWENVLCFLVRDDWGKPCFARAGLFEMKSDGIPEGWKFSLLPGIRASGREVWVTPIGAMWGYGELVDNPDHLGLLAERDPFAVAIFEREHALRSAATCD